MRLPADRIVADGEEVESPPTWPSPPMEGGRRVTAGFWLPIIGVAVSAYVIAYLTVTDPERYANYVTGFVPILSRRGGRLLMVDEDVTVLEGKPEPGRHVIIEFPDRGAADPDASSLTTCRVR